MAMKKGEKVIRWTNADLETLRYSFKRMTVADLARSLNRSVSSVTKKAHDLCLRKRPLRYDGQVRIVRVENGLKAMIYYGGKPRSYMRHLWEKYNGPIPEGTRVVSTGSGPCDFRKLQTLELRSVKIHMITSIFACSKDEAIVRDMISELKGLHNLKKKKHGKDINKRPTVCSL